MIAAMKTITSTLAGLASSLLLNAGFSHAAQTLDPVSRHPASWTNDANGPALSAPCAFTPKRGR